LTDLPEEPTLPPPVGINPRVAGIVFGGLGLLVAGLLVTLALLRKSEPPPREIEGNPQLLAGRAVFLDRCLSCHGPKGKGDGPIAKALKGPPVGDLTARTWKHGDAPDQVERLIAEGVANSAMPGWGRTLGPDDLLAVTAYVYYLGGREVPALLRQVRSGQ
jgi:cytochrome c oxidase cbb3-type subunit III